MINSSKKECDNKNSTGMEWLDEFSTLMECEISMVMQWSVGVRIVLKKSMVIRIEL